MAGGELRAKIMAAVRSIVSGNWPLLGLLLLGMGLRLLRLTWQPLWADEGYSIYFATEDPARILWLTARDIHPPLYYLLLHLWQQIFGGATPFDLRLFSVTLALPAIALIALLARQRFAGRRRLALIATCLLAVSPMHLFYSQEVRMYGLAMTMGLAATIAFGQAMAPRHKSLDRSSGRWWLAYCLLATASLYTLYYTGLLLLAHLLWALWVTRFNPRQLRILFWVYLGIVLLYLPWVFYTATELMTYVEDKVGADQDAPLGLFAYLSRHLLTFLAGHLTPSTWSPLWRAIGIFGILLPLLALLRRAKPLATTADGKFHTYGLLWFCLLIPTTLAFVINRLYPFFPDGGERLLLLVLPYFLLLLALALDQTWQRWHVGKVALLTLLLSATGGIGIFYTLSRHTDDDYRPLLRQVVQQGTDQDTLLATFPWQVGLWRAYAPELGLDLQHGDGPQLHLVSERSVTWDRPIQEAINRALVEGTLWYPGLRTIGSTLPTEIGTFLEERATLLVEQWYGNTTLWAWHTLSPSVLMPMTIDFGPVQLTDAGVSATTAASANTPLRVDLAWLAADALVDHGMTLRLQRAGQTWANRDLEQLAPTTGLLIPAGLPPDRYELMLGVVDEYGQLLPPNGASPPASLVSLGSLHVTAPVLPLPVARLPMQVPLTTPLVADGLALVGYSHGATTPLAGEIIQLMFFWQSRTDAPPLRHLYVSLLDATGNGVAGWDGWPLPAHPTTALQTGALLQTPVTFALPPTLITDNYQLIAGVLDPETGIKSPYATLGEQAVRQRDINLTPLIPPTAFEVPFHFGNHAWLLGYDLARATDVLTLQLYWQITQPLLPPHHIFVHLNNHAGQTVAQYDGVPQSATEEAPTGSWLPDEYLVTEQVIPLRDLSADTTSAEMMLHVGLYYPANGARLPVTVDGVLVGDLVRIPVD